MGAQRSANVEIAISILVYLLGFTIITYIKLSELLMLCVRNHHSQCI